MCKHCCKHWWSRGKHNGQDPAVTSHMSGGGRQIQSRSFLTLINTANKIGSQERVAVVEKGDSFLSGDQRRLLSGGNV